MTVRRSGGASAAAFFAIRWSAERVQALAVIGIRKTMRRAARFMSRAHGIRRLRPPPGDTLRVPRLPERDRPAGDRRRARRARDARRPGARTTRSGRAEAVRI